MTVNAKNVMCDDQYCRAVAKEGTPGWRRIHPAGLLCPKHAKERVTLMVASIISYGRGQRKKSSEVAKEIIHELWR